MSTGYGFVELRFHAMGTEVAVLARSAPATTELVAAVERLFEEQEQRFSRFRPDSELMQLNAGAVGAPSHDMREVLNRAERWFEATGGDFDPTVFRALELAGYNTTFADVAAHTSVGNSERGAPPDMPRRISFAEVLRHSGPGFGEFRLPDAVQIDLSGIVKGWTVDRAAGILAPVQDFAIDAGGDLRVLGDSPDGPGWSVGLEDPFTPGADSDYLVLHDAAAATSGTYRRRWATGNGSPAHHLIDPRSGKPSASDVISVTVTGPDTETCEIYAKTALLRGSDAGLPLLDSIPGIEGMLTLSDGSRLYTRDWPGLKALRRGDDGLAETAELAHA